MGCACYQSYASKRGVGGGGGEKEGRGVGGSDDESGIGMYWGKGKMIIRSASITLDLLHVRTNYGKFNIRFASATIWNNLEEHTSFLQNHSTKVKLKFIQP